MFGHQEIKFALIKGFICPKAQELLPMLIAEHFSQNKIKFKKKKKKKLAKNIFRGKKNNLNSYVAKISHSVVSFFVKL